jgi:uncharacterized phage protein (TIGR01671 family)
MRHLKFRFWNTLAHRFQPASKYAIQGDGQCIGYDYDMMAWDDPFDIEKSFIVAQQFTGNKDIEEKEIYEGDFVELVFALQTHPVTGEKSAPTDSFGVYSVYYSEESAAFKLKVIRNNWFGVAFVTKEEAAKRTINPECPVTPILEDELKNYKVCRVIGNIFENPELLKQ